MINLDSESSTRLPSKNLGFFSLSLFWTNSPPNEPIILMTLIFLRMVRQLSFAFIMFLSSSHFLSNRRFSLYSFSICIWISRSAPWSSTLDFVFFRSSFLCSLISRFLVMHLQHLWLRWCLLWWAFFLSSIAFCFWRSCSNFSSQFLTNFVTLSFSRIIYWVGYFL